MSAATVEDYKKYVRELKTRIKSLTETNTKLKDQLDKAEAGKKDRKGDNVNMLVKANKSVVLLQKHIRGFIIRRKFERTLKASKMLGKVRETDDRKSSENEQLLQSLMSSCAKIGLNLEMVFRAADQNRDQQVTREELSSLLSKLKINMSRKKAERCASLFDEQNHGCIDHNDFCITLFAYNVSSEPLSVQLARTHLSTLMEEVGEMCLSENPFEVHAGDKIKHDEFVQILSDLYSSNGSTFSERDCELLFNHFDRKKCGLLDKKSIVFKAIPTQKLAVLTEMPVSDNCSMMRSQVIHKTPAKLITQRPMTAGRAGNNTELYKQIVKAIAGKEGSLQPFLEQLASFAMSLKHKLNNRTMSSADFSNFLKSQSCAKLTPELKHQWLQELTKPANNQASKDAKAWRIRPSSGSSGFVDLMSLRTKMNSATSKQTVSLKFLQTMIAADLESKGVSTVHFFSQNGLNADRKIDFSEFYSFVSRNFDGNYNEATAWFESRQEQSAKLVKVSQVIQDIDSVRGASSPNASNTKSDVDKKSGFEAIRRKVLLGSLDMMEKIVNKIQQNSALLARKIDKGEADQLWKGSFGETLTDFEINVLLERMGAANQAQIDLYELLDFLVDNFSAKKEVVQVYIKVIAGYLDKNASGQSTEDYFADHDWPKSRNYEKQVFCSKLKQLFGFKNAHCEMFFEQFKDSGSNSVNVGILISAIESKRKDTATQVKQKTDEPKRTEIVKSEPEKPVSVAVNIPNETKEQPQPKMPEVKPKVEATLQKEETKQQPPVERPTIVQKEEPKQPAGQVKQPEQKKPAGWKPFDITQELPEKAAGKKTCKMPLSQLLTKMENLKQSKLPELRALNEFIERETLTELQILELRRYCSGIFNAEEATLLFDVFYHCDKNRNGTIDASEWNEIENKLVIKERPPAPELAPQIPTFETEEQVYQLLTKSLDSKFRLPIEFLNEFSASQDQPIAVIKLNRHALSFYGGKSKGAFEFFRKLMRFFDNDGNGFFSYHFVRFIVSLMNPEAVQQAASTTKINFDFLRDYGISADVLRVFGNKVLDTFVRGSCLDFGVVDTSNKVNLFWLAQNLSSCLPSGGVYESVLDWIHQLYNSKRSLSVPLEEILKAIGATDMTNSYWARSNDSQNEIVIKELKALKTRLIRTNGRQYMVDNIQSKDIPKAVSDHFKFDRKDPSELAEFVTFLLFAKLPETEEICDAPKTKTMENLISNMPNLTIEFALENVTKSLSKCPIKTETLSKLIADTVDETNKKMNVLMFSKLLSRLPFNLEDHQTFALYNHLENNTGGNVTADEFISYYQKSRPKAATKRRESLRTANPTSEEKKSFELLKNIKFGPSDFFRGKETILNGAIVALKQASELISKLGPLQKFVDPEFGPCTDDPYGSRSIYYDQPPPGYRSPENLVWMRPDQISTSKPPVFIEKQAKANDVEQGEIGDCWLISALSSLALDDNHIYQTIDPKTIREGLMNDEQTQALLNGVYPALFHFLAKYGMYVFRFFKDGDWRFVIIDDLLPCSDDNPEHLQLVFGHCHESNCFWVPLIEKAYAKIHGCYQATIAGQMDQGLVDLTGLINDKMLLKAAGNKFNANDLTSPEVLWKKLDRLLSDGSLLGCSVAGEKNEVEGKLVIDGERVGLVCGHAYGILDLLEINGVKLVRIRNPWGGQTDEGLWNGRFSNNTKELIDLLPKINDAIVKKWKDEAEPYQLGVEDGTFFMEYSQFLSIWQMVCVAVKFPKTFSGKRINGEWDASNSGGTPTSNTPAAMQAFGRNPQIIIKLKAAKPTNFYFSLAQEDGRIKSAGKERSPFNSFMTKFCLTVCKLGPSEKRVEQWGRNEVLNKLQIRQSRETQFALLLERGTYAVIPSTMEAGVNAKFFLSVYYDCQEGEIEITDADGRWTARQIREEEEAPANFDDNLKALLTALYLEKQ